MAARDRGRCMSDRPVQGGYPWSLMAKARRLRTAPPLVSGSPAQPPTLVLRPEAGSRTSSVCSMKAPSEREPVGCDASVVDASADAGSPHNVAAKLLRDAASELHQAARHSLVAADHIDECEAPRMLAHAWASRGHVVTALGYLDQAARLHATMSRVPEDNPAQAE
jgi:hypothetical protein